jgi:hypothetical protein
LQIASFITEIALLAVKVAKSTSNVRTNLSTYAVLLIHTQPVLLRYQALRALRKSLSVASRSATDNAIKEVTKQARNLLSDKAFCIQAAASEVSNPHTAFIRANNIR